MCLQDTECESSGGGADVTDEDKRGVLAGRIYPAIRSCIGNRYRILAGLFAYYAFILSDAQRAKSIGSTQLTQAVSLLFAFFIVHNWWNYYSMAKEQWKFEEGDIVSLFRAVIRSPVETMFAIVALLAVWIAYIGFNPN